MGSMLAQSMQLLWTALDTATNYFGRIVQACGMPFGLFITLICSLMVIDLIFVAYRYRTIGEVMGDKAEKFSSSASEHDRASSAYYQSQTNKAIYAKLRERGKR